MTDQELIELSRQGLKVHPSQKAHKRRRTCLHRLVSTLRGRNLL